MSETSDDRVKTDTDKHVFTHAILTIGTADVLSVQTVTERVERFNQFELNVLPILTVSPFVE